MATNKQKPELLVIVGPTASGKSALAIKIAEDYNGEIICADSRTIYKNMDIGTAKPSIQDQKKVRHWGLDLVEPGSEFSAKQFKDYARQVVQNIQIRGKLPIVVGGTGLYIDGLVFDYDFRPAAPPERRAELNGKSVEELRQIITKYDYPMPENSHNKRHLSRVIETEGQATPIKNAPVYKTLMVGINPPDNILKDRIAKRAAAMFENGVVDETRRLVKAYGLGKISQASGLAYGLCLKVMSGEITESEAVKLNQIADWQYAKRQRTWFKRNPNILWNEDKDSAERTIKTALNN